MFNKADLFHFQSLPVEVALPLILLFLHVTLRLGFEDWYICMNIYCWCACSVLSLFFGDKIIFSWLSYFLLISFDSTCNWHIYFFLCSCFVCASDSFITCGLYFCVFHLWFIVKTTLVEKVIYNIFWYLKIKINNVVVKNLFIVCLLFLAGLQRHESLSKLFMVNFLLGVYVLYKILQRVHSVCKR